MVGRDFDDVVYGIRGMGREGEKDGVCGCGVVEGLGFENR